MVGILFDGLMEMVVGTHYFVEFRVLHVILCHKLSHF